MGLPRGRRRQREANQTFRLFGDSTMCSSSGFSSNRGYILEGAADTAGKEQMILECLAATV